MTAVVPIRELDTVLDRNTVAAMRLFSDSQVGWFWNIFLKLRVAPDYRLPFDDQFWSLTGAKTKGYWLTQSAPVLACFERQSIAGQTWIWHSGLVRLAEAGSQFGNQPANGDPEKPDSLKKAHPPIYELFLVAYKNYPKHVEKKESERKFLLAIKEHSKQQKIPLIDSAEFIAHKCSEYAAATARAGIEKQFIPNMAKWLHRGRYQDDPSEWITSYKLNDKKQESTMQERLRGIEQMDF